MVATLLPVIALVYLFISLQSLARRKPDYSHFRHTISELGEIGAPDQRLVARGVFLPVGLAMAWVGAMLHGVVPAGSALAYCIAAGYLVASLFPCDPGSPVHGTARQSIHNLGGAVEYIGGALSLFWAGQHYGSFYKVIAMVAIGAAIALTVLPSGAPRGLVQRVAEVCLFIGVSHLAWVAWSGHSHAAVERSQGREWSVCWRTIDSRSAPAAVCGTATEERRRVRHVANRRDD
jgi:hypothetical protein